MCFCLFVFWREYTLLELVVAGVWTVQSVYGGYICCEGAGVAWIAIPWTVVMIRMERNANKRLDNCDIEYLRWQGVDKMECCGGVGVLESSASLR